MSILDLITIYLIVGGGCAMLVYLRNTPHRLLSALCTLVLWPFWAPMVLHASPKLEVGALGRIDDELERTRAAIAGTALERLLPSDAIDHIRQQVAQAQARQNQLGELLSLPEFSLEDAEARLASLRPHGASQSGGRALQTAQLHRDNIARLSALQHAQQRQIDELLANLKALRSQLLVTHYAGSSPHAVDDMVQEVWNRVEALREALEDGEALPTDTASAITAARH